jgi:hypothetical protein
LILSLRLDFVLLKYIGFALAGIGVIAIIYFTLGFLFAPVLVFEKKMGINHAMKASLCGFSQHWFKITVLLVILELITIISAIPFGIGLIWTVPLGMNVMGSLYRTTFGVGTH